MLDPFPPPPAWLRDWVDPWAVYYNLPAVSDHIHEILFAFFTYQLIHFVISPWLSPILFPRHYPRLNHRTKLNWDVHVVSLVQSVFINALALWSMYADDERWTMTTDERIYGYTGVCGLTAAFAAGYFVYDLIVSVIYVRMFGIGMLFHAVSALWVFSFGYRPFINFYSPTFILYELSSPFLNIHWFLDKVNMTGSNLQWYNGMALLFTFFGCRLIWGTWQSILVYKDLWYAVNQNWSTVTSLPLQARDASHCLDQACTLATAEVARFSAQNANGIPTWLCVTYFISNVVLNSLNYYWFSKMVETVMKRFRAPAPTPKKDEKVSQLKEDIAQKVVLDAAAKLEQEEGSPFLEELTDEKIASAVDTGLNDELRRRRS